MGHCLLNLRVGAKSLNIRRERSIADLDFPRRLRIGFLDHPYHDERQPSVRLEAFDMELPRNCLKPPSQGFEVDDSLVEHPSELVC